jgi:carboxyl-terminal processing protease
MRTEQATTLLKGPRGSKVSLKIIRDGSIDILTVVITRDVIKEQQSLCFYIESKNIYYLSLSMFAETSASQLTALLKKANEQNYRGLILDLRNNSGGLLSSAVDIAGLFLDKGTVVVTTKNKDHSKSEMYKTKKNPVANRSIPIVILINNYTASAAEILAGCLKIHAEKTSSSNPLLVFLVGTTTFGKGSVQEVIPIGKNSAIKLTTALYFLPYDTVVQGVGISPDITVERCTPPSEQTIWLTENYGHENNLDNYIKVKETENATDINTPSKPKNSKSTQSQHGSGTNGEEERWQSRVKKMLETDNQLREAINVLSLIANAKKNLPTLIYNRTTALAYLQQNYLTDNTVDIVEVKL